MTALDLPQNTLSDWLSSYFKQSPDEAYRIVCPRCRGCSRCEKDRDLIGGHVAKQWSRLCPWNRSVWIPSNRKLEFKDVVILADNPCRRARCHITKTRVAYWKVSLRGKRKDLAKHHSFTRLYAGECNPPFLFINPVNSCAYLVISEQADKVTPEEREEGWERIYTYKKWLLKNVFSEGTLLILPIDEGQPSSRENAPPWVIQYWRILSSH